MSVAGEQRALASPSPIVCLSVARPSAVCPSPRLPCPACPACPAHSALALVRLPIRPALFTACHSQD
eukprot:3790840-Alexandrium_andersonii.AAC.1